MADEFNQIPNPSPQQNADVQSAVNAALEAEKKKKKKKKWIIIGVILAVIVIIGVAGSKGGDGKKVESSDGTTAAGSVEPAAPEKEETEAGPVKVTAGNVVTTDKLKITYVSCETDYKKYNEYAAPDSGNKVVRAAFKFENISDSDVSLSGFDCYADDKKCETFYGADDDASPTLESVSPGRTFDAVVYFEVPKDAKTVELEFEDNLWGNEKTIFIIK